MAPSPRRWPRRAPILLLAIRLAVVLLAALLVMATPGAERVARAADLNVLHKGLEQYPLEGRFDLLEDAARYLSVDDARAPSTLARFRPASAGSTTIGYTASAWWLHYRFENRSVAADDWQMEIWSVPTDEAAWWVYDGDGLVGGGTTGALSGQPQTRASYYPIDVVLPEGHTRDVFVRLTSSQRMRAPMAIYTLRAIAERDLGKQWLMGILFGIGVAMMLYNFFLFLSLRDATYLLYIVYGLSIWTLLLGENGYVDLFLGPWERALGLRWALLTLPVTTFTVAMALLFARAFLRTARRSRLIDRALVLAAGLALLLSVITLTPWARTHRESVGGAVDAVLLFGIAMMLVASASAIRARFRPAYFYLGSWWAVFTAVGIFLAEGHGLLGTSVVTRYAIELGVSAEMILISLGLADHVEVVRAELLRTITLTNAALEERVGARTRALTATVQAREEFLSVASHELLTPITALKLQAQMAQREMNRISPEAMPDRVRRFVDQAVKQGDRLATLVDDMLDVSRLQRGRLEIRHERFDMSAMVREVADGFAPQFREARCTITVSVAPSLIGEWDRFRIEQVVTNLLLNAARYGAGTAVEAGCREGGADHPDHAVLWVKDQGPGIPAEDQERIFHRFERGSGTQEIAGMGLGLYISQQIVELHGGNIHVESVPGHGAAFYVTLPKHLDRV